MASKKSKGNPVQGHGEAWEKEILQTVYGVYPESGISYTSIHDVPKELNQRTGKNVSIKCSGSKTVCFGDASRIVETLGKNSPLEVIVEKTESEPFASAAPPAPTVTVYA